MQAAMIVVKALMRRIATAVVATVVASYAGWLQAALEGDEATAAWWPVVWLAIEAVQKWWRERAK